MSSNTNLHRQVTDWTLNGIQAFRATEDNDFDEEVIFAVALQAFPDPTREIEQGWIPQIVVYLEISSAPGTSVYGTSIFRPFALTETLVADFVTTALKDMVLRRETARQQRANKAGESPQQPAER